MQSLRTRRSQRQAAPTKLTKPQTQPIPRENRAKSRVDDKIKKRMSMRYADISSPTELAPPVPNILAQQHRRTQTHSPGPSYDAENGRSRRTKEDKRFLDADDFDPDAFLKLKLANSTEAELKSLQSSLQAAKEDTARDLQRSVFKNYAEFVLISKEISTLENELTELKDMLSEYKSMPSQLYIPDPTTISSSTLSTYRRSSVADLRIMYYNQMQTLHASIEGAAKFAPITPGRHIVSELDGITSLNAATYKATGKVKFVILDDAVLVARRRRRNTGDDGGGSSRSGSISSGRLVAEHCWSLNDFLVLDTKDSSRIANVFKIRYAKETHVYRTDSPGDKKALLMQLRQAAEELQAKKRKEREGEHERRKTMFQAGDGGDRSVPPMADWMIDLAKRAGNIPGVGIDAKEKVERDTRWTNDWADQLTMAIAVREWTKAVELVEKGQDRLAITPPLEAKLPVLKSQLITALLDALSKTAIRKTTVVTLMSLLVRLNAGTAARNALFRMRSQVIKSHVRNIPFEGNICSYIGDLAIVYFTGLKHSADWFLASFQENQAASAYIDWAQKEVEEYAEIFRKQVFTPGVDPKVVHEAIQITHSQHKRLLQEYGLDFSYLFDELLVEQPRVQPKLESTFSFNAHNRLSKQILSSLSNTTTPTVTPKQASINGRRTPPIQVLNGSSSTVDTPPVPALPSYLKQPSRPMSRNSTSVSESDRSPTLHSTLLSPDAGRESSATSTSIHSISSPSNPSIEPPPPLTFPAFSPPTSPYGTLPFSAGSAGSTNSFATLGNVFSPPATNGRVMFSIPSRSGARTPTSAREPPIKGTGGTPGTYTSPLSSPAPQNISSLVPGSSEVPTTHTPPLTSAPAPQGPLAGHRLPSKMASVTSLNGTSPAARESVNLNPGVNGSQGKLPPQTRSLRSVASAINVSAGAPPTPARSNNRPASRTGHRPPPVAVPQHDGMI